MGTENTLFPIFQPALKGMVRMAAEAQHADDGHLVEFRTLEVHSILSKVRSKRLRWMAYGINPYRGCEFGCRYCYARYTHEFLAPKEGTEAAMQGEDLRDPELFERLIFIKQNAAWLLEQELRKINPAQEIALGTATDPYQPIERRTRITRSLLEVFARKSGLRLGIVTKSRLIERDTDLLKAISEHNTLVVHLTITTTDVDLARKLEPRAPRPDLRFRALQRLRAAGIIAGVLCSPLLPGVNDTPDSLDKVARRAAESGASFLAAGPLFLKPCSRPTYFQFIEEHFPSLMPEYARRYGNADFASETYKREMVARLAALRERYGINPRPSMEGAEQHKGRRTPARVQPPAQQRLFA